MDITAIGEELEASPAVVDKSEKKPYEVPTGKFWLHDDRTDDDANKRCRPLTALPIIPLCPSSQIHILHIDDCEPRPSCSHALAVCICCESVEGSQDVHKFLQGMAFAQQMALNPVSHPSYPNLLQNSNCTASCPSMASNSCQDSANKFHC